VLATHADTALALLDEPSASERELLGAFRYSRNRAVLHRDATLMPKRRKVWSSWNFLGRRGGDAEALCVTYWMNRLQSLAGADHFVTLNPTRTPRDVVYETTYEHPIFDLGALAAQRRLWSLQGRGNVWFAGAHFGAGFHEDGLQAGLAVAEALGGVRRPWQVDGESSRITPPVQELAA
ncbi:MAG: NAD/FAD-binding protein, partial [Beijerinckiaceae bacterium]|nr:NAD/FAD-binding protein [Beijerinckiaceae bacterium]